MVRIDQVILTSLCFLLCAGTLSAQGKRPASMGFPHYGLEGSSISIFVKETADSLVVEQEPVAELDSAITVDSDSLLIDFDMEVEEPLAVDSLAAPLEVMAVDSLIEVEAELDSVPVLIPDTVPAIEVPRVVDTLNVGMNSTVVDTLSAGMTPAIVDTLHADIPPVVIDSLHSVAVPAVVDTVIVVPLPKVPAIDSIPEITEPVLPDSMKVNQPEVVTPKVVVPPVLVPAKKDSIPSGNKLEGKAESWHLENAGGVTFLKEKEGKTTEVLSGPKQTVVMEDKEKKVEKVQQDSSPRVNRGVTAVPITRVNQSDTTIVHVHNYFNGDSETPVDTDKYAGMSAYERNKQMRMDAEAERKALMQQSASIPAPPVQKVDTVVKIVYVQAPAANTATIPPPPPPTIPSTKVAPEQSMTGAAAIVPVSPAVVAPVVVVKANPDQARKDSLEAIRLAAMEKEIDNLNYRMDTLVDALGKKQVFKSSELAVPLARFKVFFAVNSHAFSSLQRTGIKSFLKDEGELGDRYLLLTGSTDSSGDAGYNKILSEKRAKSVKEYLLSLGVPADRILIDAQGEHNASEKFDETERKVTIDFVRSKPQS